MITLEVALVPLNLTNGRDFGINTVTREDTERCKLTTLLMCGEGGKKA